MTINQSGWRPTAPEASDEAPATFTGNRALMLEEPLLFEIGDTQTTGVDFAAGPAGAARLGGLERNRDIGLAGLSEPETVRHYTRLSRQNYAIDLGIFPLGSCTMKHNPRLNEKVARMPGFADIHPLQPIDTVQGALALDRSAGGLAGQADRHAQRRDEPQGRRAWRIVRPARDPLGAGGARRCARGDPRPRKRARHQSRHRRLRRLSRREHPRDRSAAASTSRR